MNSTKTSLGRRQNAHHRDFQDDEVRFFDPSQLFVHVAAGGRLCLRLARDHLFLSYRNGLGRSQHFRSLLGYCSWMATRLLHDGAMMFLESELCQSFFGNAILFSLSSVGLAKRENPSGHKKTKRHGTGSRFSPKYATGVISSVTPSQSNNLLLHVRGGLASLWHLMPG